MNPFFKVRREKLKTVDSELLLDKEALINDETGDLLGIVSPGYQIVTHEQVASLFDEALSHYKYELVGDYNDSTGRRWKRRLIFRDDDLVFNIGGDSTGVMLELFNGYDARTAFGYNLLGFRSFCSNGLVMGRKDLFRESLSHFTDAIDRLQHSFELKWPAFRSTVDVWQSWTQMPFGKDDFQAFVESKVKSSNNKKGYISNKLAETVVLEWKPLLEKNKCEETAWGSFNVLTWLATHKTKARRGSALFSNGYKLMSRLAEDFYLEVPSN